MTGKTANAEELVTIEIDGRKIQAVKNSMVIQAADEAGIYIPRFCYHDKLSVAANCRMCLVEVDKAPKPMPACATPVMDGMKVFTKSEKAKNSQRGVMEFLLINHPLDCPICDQGGECELQDLALGFGRDVSRFTERKRVVVDKDIGPLIATEMTRCIHCTRCIRFGEEIAGVRELGATGRGEKMEIGTYIAKTVVSEMSGNVIDLCPVGALTAKPSRFAARAWELTRCAQVSPHDCAGSNIYLHTLRSSVIRAVPRNNEAINEAWLSDRDRFSYEGIEHPDRLLNPMIKRNGEWETVEWDDAFHYVAKALKDNQMQYGNDHLGAWVSPSVTIEEGYLLQKLIRELGSNNIDHRLRQSDFRDQTEAPVYPWLGQSIAALETIDAALLIGSNVRKEQPIIAHRLRKSALNGASISSIGPRKFAFNFPLAENIAGNPVAMVSALSRIAGTLANGNPPAVLSKILAGIEPDDKTKRIAQQLVNAKNASILIGNIAHAHPDFSTLRSLAIYIAEQTNASFGYLTDGANSTGAWLAGVLPHRAAGAKAANKAGMSYADMVAQPRKAMVLVNVEPSFDCLDGDVATDAISEAQTVIVLSCYADERTRTYADVMLPIAPFGENEGTYINCEGKAQAFTAATKLHGEARPGWKVLRMLGSRFGLDGFGYESLGNVTQAFNDECGEIKGNNQTSLTAVEASTDQPETGLFRVGDIPIYAVDSLVRRAAALQQTPDARGAVVVMHPILAKAHQLETGATVTISQNGKSVTLPFEVDDSIPNDCVWISAGLPDSCRLGSPFGEVEIVTGSAG
ncbi:MAG: NADH-quinone oxidoreductase subunit NuoG [Gammaproteobacteria bacterium]|nr:MAG: NADH-quinone oxidoreductase subunit NuoG [Gammaproteobacteria bacterium]